MSVATASGVEALLRRLFSAEGGEISGLDLISAWESVVLELRRSKLHYREQAVIVSAVMASLLSEGAAAEERVASVRQWHRFVTRLGLADPPLSRCRRSWRALPRPVLPCPSCCSSRPFRGRSPPPLPEHPSWTLLCAGWSWRRSRSHGCSSSWHSSLPSLRRPTCILTTWSDTPATRPLSRQ